MRIHPSAPTVGIGAGDRRGGADEQPGKGEDGARKRRPVPLWRQRGLDGDGDRATKVDLRTARWLLCGYPTALVMRREDKTDPARAVRACSTLCPRTAGTVTSVGGSAASVTVTEEPRETSEPAAGR